MKILALSVLIALCLLQMANSADPKNPIWADHFTQGFTQTYANSKHYIVGKFLFDANRQMYKVQRSNGQYESLCGSVLPNITTPCSQLTRDGKRYMIYPEQKKCCICCDAAHGCGFLKKDWLSTAKYEGVQVLTGQQFDKWSIPDGDKMDYYWATRDAKQTPRRMTQVGSRFKDFIMSSYDESQIQSIHFDLPAYCGSAYCPKQSFCGFFQSKTPNIQSQ